MHRIDTSTAQKDKFGAGKNGFTGGNPQTGELPTALNADFFDSVQEEIAAVIEAAGLTLTKSNRAQLLAAMNKLVGPGRLINVQVFTASGTFTPTPGANKFIVEVQAPGGGGARTGYTGSTEVSVATGGTGGGYAKSLFKLSDLAATVIVSVGTIGQPGTTYPGNGSDGGDATFGSYITCKGGKGGYAQAKATPPLSCTGILGGTASGGNIENIPGQPSGDAIAVSVSTAIAGHGGASQKGTGGFSPSNSNTNGYDALGYGGGGGGCWSANQATAGATGGKGAPGLVIVWEYA